MTVVDLDGVYPDGWCGPMVRIRGIANVSASHLTATVWLPGIRSRSTIFRYLVDGQRRPYATVPFDTSTSIATPLALRAADEVSFSLICAHVVRESGDDGRELSFIMEKLEIT